MELREDLKLAGITYYPVALDFILRIWSLNKTLNYRVHVKMFSNEALFYFIKQNMFISFNFFKIITYIWRVFFIKCNDYAVSSDMS